jgi:hypothetical protein
MTRIRCPQNRCIFWEKGWCDAEEIELDLRTLACITFEEVDDANVMAVDVLDDNDLEWEDDEPIFDDEWDEDLYGVDDEEEEDDDGGLAVEDKYNVDDWSG